MKKETMYFPAAFAAVFGGIVAAIICADQTAGMALGMSGALAGAILFGLGLHSIFSVQTKQYEAQAAENAKQAEALQTFFTGLNDRIEAQTAAVLQAVQETAAEYKQRQTATEAERRELIQQLIECIMHCAKNAQTQLKHTETVLAETEGRLEQRVQTIAEDVQKQNLEFQEGTIEELSAINKLLTSSGKATETVAEAVDEAVNTISGIQRILSKLRDEQTKRLDKIADAIEDEKQEASETVASLTQSICELVSENASMLQTYSAVTEQDTQMIKQLLEE